MSDSDTECLIEAGEAKLLAQENARRRRFFGKRAGLRAVVALTTLGCAAGAALLVAHHGRMARRPGEAAAKALEHGMMQLALSPSQCAAYTDCAALPGDCCPTEAGIMLGCCNSPKLEAINAPMLEANLEAEPQAMPGQCLDTMGWTNGYSLCVLHGYTIMHGCTPTGLNCHAYELLGFCANGAVLPGKQWALGPVLHSPEENCCVCGKAPEPPMPTEEPEQLPPPMVPAPAPQVVPPPEAPAAVTTLGPAAMATVAPEIVATAVPTSAPLAGGAAPNGTQGEPVGTECEANAGCKSLGITGQCCPTADGTMLGCCSPDLGATGPVLLPKAKGPGPLMTFYMYRVANDEDYPINGVNMANLAGDMWYLHNEVVQHCPRKFNMERLLRFKVTTRATPELYGQGRNFDSFVAFDQAKCTVPMCPKLHWDPFGYVVGCQPNNVGQVAVPGSPTWYSLPGTCPNKFYYEKTEACNSAEPGGACPTSDVTGGRNCTYFFERAGEIRLDDLSGLQDYNKVCQEAGILEYDETKDVGVGTKFWDGKTDAEAGARRMQIVKELFAKNFPSAPTELADPPCDVQG
mmetsp:Transcript_16802/g.47994  ORF Transcript_16802/g.47994 Transcript_16802/m.47994 type:complete len:576 (+) Transcript_16802:80-1807(+)